MAHSLGEDGEDEEEEEDQERHTNYLMEVRWRGLAGYVAGGQSRASPPRLLLSRINRLFCQCVMLPVLFWSVG